MPEKFELNHEVIEYDWGYKTIISIAEEVLFKSNFTPISSRRLIEGQGFIDHFGDLKKQDVSINKDGYRSDDFTRIHNGKHILFAGCSHTYGIGLSDSEMWSKKIYQSITSEEEVSGYFNISSPGASLIHEMLLLIKYCKEFGYPNYLFFGVPGTGRKYEYFEDLKKYRMVINKVYEKIDHPKMNKMRKDFELDVFLYYTFLDEFCSAHKIKLISFYHEFPQDVDHLILNRFDSFHLLSKESLYEYIYNYQVDNPNDKYYIEARDGSHYGTAINKFIYEELLSRYRNLK